MRLLLVRHGETDHNAGRITMGRRDVPLNERGRAQAAALAARLRDGRFGTLAAIYCSPLQRARATAQAIADACGLAPTVEPDLVEMEIGAVEDMSYDQVRERFPEFIRGWLSEDPSDVPMPGGETLRGVQERAWAVVEALLARHAEDTVAIVSHNFVILTLLCRALGLPLSHFRRLRQDVAAVSVLDLRPERETLLSLNDRCHLD